MNGALALRLVGAVIGFALGGAFLKRYADSGQSSDLALSLAAYLAANLAFVEILKRGLGFGIVLSSMAQLCLMVVVGAVFFGERIQAIQGLGVLLALLAIAAFSLGSQARP